MRSEAIRQKFSKQKRKAFIRGMVSTVDIGGSAAQDIEIVSPRRVKAIVWKSVSQDMYKVLGYKGRIAKAKPAKGLPKPSGGASATAALIKRLVAIK